jgi:formylglycine-generating enzyme required for sulfatase activity
LPTEAEWEYAARGGEIAATYGSLTEIAWYGSYAYRDGQTQPVKRRKPNAYGLYDMLGNVWEWTADGYSEAIPGGLDPRVPPSERCRFEAGHGSTDRRTSVRRAATGMTHRTGASYWASDVPGTSRKRLWLRPFC